MFNRPSSLCFASPDGTKLRQTAAVKEWVGIAGVTVYAPTIFGIAGYDSTKSAWISGLNNIFYMFATLICVFTLDRIGRRWTLYWGAIGQGIAMFLAGGFSRLGQDARNAGDSGLAGSYGAAAASFVFIFTSVFGATWLTVPWLYPAEIFPLQVRAKGNAWGVFGWSIGNGWLTLLCPVMFSAIGEKTVSIAERDAFTADNFLAHTKHLASFPRKKNIFLIQNLTVIYFWSLQRCRHPYSLGALSREQPKDTRRNGPVVCCTNTCKCIFHTLLAHLETQVCLGIPFN